MFLFKVSEPHRWRRRAALGAALFMLLSACGDVKEWEPQSGSLTLSATPLPAEEGLPITLAVEGKNVGPISVYQGKVLIATFANVELDGKKSYTVTAISSETPRAEAVAYDFRRLSVEATGFSGTPGPSGGGGSSSGGAGGMGNTPLVDDCPGYREAPGECSQVTDGSVALSVRNTTDSPVSVYERQVTGVDDCFNQILAIIPPGESRSLSTLAPGSVVVLIKDAGAELLRTFSLPTTPTCTIVL